MTHYEFELEVMSYFEAKAILAGKKKPGPSQEFMNRVRELKQKAEQGTPVTPEELGWKT